MSLVLEKEYKTRYGQVFTNYYILKDGHQHLRDLQLKKIDPEFTYMIAPWCSVSKTDLNDRGYKLTTNMEEADCIIVSRDFAVKTYEASWLPFYGDNIDENVYGRFYASYCKLIKRHYEFVVELINSNKYIINENLCYSHGLKDFEDADFDTFLKYFRNSPEIAYQLLKSYNYTSVKPYNYITSERFYAACCLLEGAKLNIEKSRHDKVLESYIKLAYGYKVSTDYWAKKCFTEEIVNKLIQYGIITIDPED